MRLLIVLCLVMGNAWATNFYVCPDTQGEYGAEDGSSLANCFDGNADIGWASINAGDTLYFCGDWLPADARITVADSGSAGNYITLSGNAAACSRTSRSTISRSGLSGASGRAIAASNTAATRQYIKITELSISDCSDYCLLWDYSTTGAVTDDTDLFVTDVSFSACGSGGSATGCIWKRGENLTVTNSSFENCYQDCIYYRGKDATITGNTFRDISTGDIGGDATQIDLTGVADSGVVVWSNNYCDHTSVDVKYCFVIGTTAGAGSSVTVEGNTALCPYPSTNGIPANACHPIYLDTATATAVKIARNFTDSGEVGISLTASAAAAFTTRAQIASNIVVRAFDRGIWTDGNVDNIDIWNNTISGAGQEALYIGKSGAALNANNNVLINSASGLFYITAPTSRGYNAYYNNTTNVDENGSAGSTTAGDVTANPNLQTASPTTAILAKPDCKQSPLRRVGTWLGPRQDYGNRAFANPPTIGAWECASGDARPTVTARP